MLRRLSATFKKTYEDTHTWGPLLITIGPHCCGKSSYIASLDENVKSHVIDSAPELYEKVALHIALNVWQDKVSGDVVQALKGRTIYDVAVLDRLKSLKGTEQVLLTMLFAKIITYKEFDEKIRNLLGNVDHDETFITCVKEIFQNKTFTFKTKTVDVFIPESVEDATIRVSQEMKKDIKTYEGVICWGNSNLNPDFYKDVLKTASKMKRVVRFVRWGKELPSVPLKELFRRNILQYFETGRYVDSSKIAKFRKYAEFFTTKAGANSHRDFAMLADYSMDAQGCVTEAAAENKKSNKPAPVVVVDKSIRWSAWTNDGIVYNLSSGAANMPLGSSSLDQSTKSGDTLSSADPSLFASQSSSSRGGTFANTNVSSAITPGPGDRTKHFFTTESDENMTNSPTSAAAATRGIAEKEPLGEARSQSGSLREGVMHNKSNSINSDIPPLVGGSSSQAASAANTPSHSRNGSKDLDEHTKKDDKGAADSAAAASTANGFFATSLFSVFAPAEPTPAAHKPASATTHMAALPETLIDSSRDENDEADNKSLPQKKAVEAEPKHVVISGASPVVVEAAAPAPAPKKSPMMSLFAHVDEPESDISAAGFDEEAEEKEVKDNSAAVFILDLSPPGPDVYDPLEEEHHREAGHTPPPLGHLASTAADMAEVEEEEREEAQHPRVIESAHHENHIVHLQDSVKLTHIHERHAHGEHASSPTGHSLEPATASPPSALRHGDSHSNKHQSPPHNHAHFTERRISFKENVEEIPVPVPGSHKHEHNTKTTPASAPVATAAATPTKQQQADANPFACILPAIFCGGV